MKENYTPFPGDITRVHGIRVGQAQSAQGMTGVTVVLCREGGATGGVSVRGAAPGTRETDLLRPGNLVEKANAVVLAGGSAYGLAAADGVMRYLESVGIGRDTGAALVPIVPAAVIYDLAVGDAHARPDAPMATAACLSANKGMQQGRVGAGTGATVAKLIQSALPRPGGVGSASITLTEGVTVGAVVVCNALGDIYHPVTGECIACAQMPDGTKVPAEGILYGHAPAPYRGRLAAPMSSDSPEIEIRMPAPGSNTTIGVVAVDCALTKEQANRLADVAHDGIARTVRPAHTQMDGDTMFALATARSGAEVNFVKLCAAAAEVTARAIANAIFFAENA